MECRDRHCPTTTPDGVNEAKEWHQIFTAAGGLVILDRQMVVVVMPTELVKAAFCVAAKNTLPR